MPLPAEAAPPESDIATRIEKELQSVAERSRDAVVKIAARDEHGPLSGTGFFIDPMGTLFTAFSVGGESDDITVTFGNKRYPAERLVADSRSGVALLKVNATGTPFLRLGSSRELQESTPVMTIGFPLDKPVAANFGMVGGFDLKHQSRFFSTRHIRANVAVQRGQGGSPLLNLRGEVVGILISSLEQGAGCFALPIEAAEKIRENYVRFGEVRHGWMGVVVEPAEVSRQGSIARVVRLGAAGPAALSGILEGDILLRVGRTDVQFPEDVFEASFFLTAGDPVPIRVWRDGEVLELEVTPSQHSTPAPRRAVQIGIPHVLDPATGTN